MYFLSHEVKKKCKNNRIALLCSWVRYGAPQVRSLRKKVVHLYFLSTVACLSSIFYTAQTGHFLAAFFFCGVFCDVFCVLWFVVILLWFVVTLVVFFYVFFFSMIFCDFFCDSYMIFFLCDSWFFGVCVCFCLFFCAFVPYAREHRNRWVSRLFHGAFFFLRCGAVWCGFAEPHRTVRMIFPLPHHAVGLPKLKIRTQRHRWPKVF